MRTLPILFAPLAPLALVALVTGLAGCGGASSSVDVGPDECLVLIATEGAPNPDRSRLARDGERGIRADVLTAGRHEVDPRRFDHERHPLVHLSAGKPPSLVDGVLVPGEPPEIGVVISQLGAEVTGGRVLAEPGERGIQRKVLTPGVYALNPYATKVEKRKATVVPPAHVGVVTRLVGELPSAEFAAAGERGVQREVLAPGIWYLNPYEFDVALLRAGYRELTFEGAKAISFPSADSYPIAVEATIVWGLAPEDAPHLVKRFGSEANLIDRVVRPQAESIIRTAGSDIAAQEFVVGDARQRFQQTVQAKLRDQLRDANVRVLLALVRHVDVPESIRKPIQLARIAEEETLTNRARQETLQAQTRLSEVQAEAHLVVASAQAETTRLAGETGARLEAERLRIEAEALLEAERFRAEVTQARSQSQAGVAAARAEQARKRAVADADAEARIVAALGSSQAYATWKVAVGLADALKVELKSSALREDDPPAPR